MLRRAVSGGAIGARVGRPAFGLEIDSECAITAR
jgi:hypothetical protein